MTSTRTARWLWFGRRVLSAGLRGVGIATPEGGQSERNKHKRRGGTTGHDGSLRWVPTIAGAIPEVNDTPSRGDQHGLLPRCSRRGGRRARTLLLLAPATGTPPCRLDECSFARRPALSSRRSAVPRLPPSSTPLRRSRPAVRAAIWSFGSP